MAILNQFQLYSQAENTVTNNVLLLFSKLYDTSSTYYEEYIQGLIESDQYSVIPEFRQQVGNKGDGIIDGHIHIRASRIVIETKLTGLEWSEKLVKYAKSFESNEDQLLFHLSTYEYSDSEKNMIESKLEVFGKNIIFKTITYQGLVDQLLELTKSYPFDALLSKLTIDFTNYCEASDLLPRSKHVLRAMACGQSFELNVKYQFYFDLAARGYSHFNYLGIYKGKAVRYIGKVENMIVANWTDGEGLDIKHSDNVVTTEQKERLSLAIKESIDEGWSVYENHRFFLLKDFHQTKFRKVSPGGIFRVRFFNLEKYLEIMPENIEQLAIELNTKEWQ